MSKIYFIIFLFFLNYYFSQFNTIIQYQCTENYSEKNINNYQLFVLTNNVEVYDIFIYHKNYSSFNAMMNDKEYLELVQYSSSLNYQKGDSAIYGINWVTNNGNYLFKDIIPEIKWIIGNEEKDILGYKCKSATTLFRGKKYKVWFAGGIPENVGPWKLSGLPGAILKVEDEDNIFAFEAVKIELNVNVSIPNKFHSYYSKKTNAITYKSMIEMEDDEDQKIREEFISGLPIGTVVINDNEALRNFKIEKKFEWEK